MVRIFLVKYMKHATQDIRSLNALNLISEYLEAMMHNMGP